MDKCGLNHADFAAYRRMLVTPGARRMVNLDILDLGTGNHLRSLSPDVLDGQIIYDTTAEVTRTASVVFADPKRTLGFEPDDPSAAPLHRSRMIRVTDSRYVDELNHWVSCHVFTGPIWDFERDGGQVTITAHGMERQALGQLWETHHFPKKSKVTDAIRALLAAVGDTGANVPDLAHTLPHDLTVHPMDSAWTHVKHLAASLDRNPFYDGAGRFHLRPFASRPVYHFRKSILDDVKVTRTADGIVNTVLVLGPNPKGPKRRPRAHAVLQGPLSPTNLGRNGVPLHLVHKVERHHLKTHAQAQKIADRLLKELAQTQTGITFDSMPLPFLEEHDMVSVSDDAFGTAHLRMRQWSLPLGSGDPGGSDGQPMTVGTIKRTTKARLR
jgi:hypothetical protein